MHILINVGKEEMLLRGEPKNFELCHLVNRHDVVTGKIKQEWVGEAVKLGFASRTFSRVIQELVEKGFIDPAGYGGLRGFCKSFNKFRISNRWEKYGTKGFNFESWKQTE